MSGILYRSAKDHRHLLLCLTSRSPLYRNSSTRFDTVVKASSVQAANVGYLCHGRLGYSDHLCFRSCVRKFLQVEEGITRGTFLWLYQPTRSQHTTLTIGTLDEVKKKEYISLYLMRNLRFFRALCIAAKMSCLALFACLPPCIAVGALGWMPQSNAMSIAWILIFYAVFFNAQSYFLASRVLGKIMISTDQEHLKFSHLTQFGARRDVYIKTSEVVPLVKTGSVFDKKLHIVRLGLSSKKLFFLPHFGLDDTNFEGLEKLFGSPPAQKEIQKQ